VTAAADCFLCSTLDDRGGYAKVTSNFRVTADIAPLIQNHCLLYPVDHLLSFGHLSASLIHESHQALLQVAALPMFSDAPLLYFEHGPNEERTNIIGCCDHAHVHILPVGLGQAESELQSLARYEAILQNDERDGRVAFVDERPFEALAHLRDENYFWVAADLRALRVFAIKQPERQYLRHVVARALGKEAYRTWDAYNDELAKNTTTNLRLQIDGASSAPDERY